MNVQPLSSVPRRGRPSTLPIGTWLATAAKLQKDQELVLSGDDLRGKTAKQVADAVWRYLRARIRFAGQFHVHEGKTQVVITKKTDTAFSE